MPEKVITLEDVERYRGLTPRRRRFADNPVVYKRGDGVWVVSPIFPSINRMFEADTGISTTSGPFGRYRFLNDEGQIKQAVEWQEARKPLIFLRDSLTCSIALDYNLKSPGAYTHLGNMEHDAKANRTPASIKSLAVSSAKALSTLSFYKDGDAVCAVPPSLGKEWDLPTEIAGRVAAKVQLEDVSELVRFRREKKSVKSVSLAEKWKTLEGGKLEVSSKIKGRRIVLIDDKYQSGTTLQFVAAKLLEAGAEDVVGLCCVKTWRDTDNI